MDTKDRLRNESPDFYLLRIFLLVCAVVLNGCRRQEVPLTAQSIVGVYKGAYRNGGVEHFTFSEDGSFSQVYSNGGQLIYVNEGRYKILEGAIQLENVIMAIDFMHLNSGQMSTQLIYTVGWDPERPSIVFNEEARYGASKIKSGQ